MPVHRAPRPHQRRVFTREEDESIVAQSLGKMSMHALEKQLHACRETIVARAAVLGVTPIIHKFRSNGGFGEVRGRRVLHPDDMPCPGDAYGNPHSVRYSGRADGLLEELIKNHSDRRYEEMDLRANQSKPEQSTHDPSL